MADNDAPFRYVAEKLIEPAGANMWPLAVLWFDPNTRGLKVSLASTGAELVQGHGRKIGVIIESQARQLVQAQKQQMRMSQIAAKLKGEPTDGSEPTVEGQHPDPGTGPGGPS